MSSTTTPRTPVQFTHAVHPDAEAYLKSIAPSSEDIRTTRSDIIDHCCTTCLKHSREPGVVLRQCGKCKSVWYCSKECQKADWPKHKEKCKKVDGSGILKLVHTLCANSLLQAYLQACFVLDFDLLRRPHLDSPFMARVDIAIEPADGPQFFRIFLGEELPETKLQGMLQVNRFTPGKPAQISPKSMTIWRELRDRVNADGFSRDPVGLVEFANGGTDNTITVAMHIQSPIMEMVEKADPFPYTSAITRKITIVPFTVEGCMEFINTQIRADKKDQLLLRTEMRPLDIQIIRDAAAGSDSVPARILNAKLAREQIYKSLLEYVRESRSA
ncbi:hypothetical protein B0H14DRAFT_2884433 [Mycena olivaceomarginata]|nr:hypothetical protein B0H14DRAFT_2884433 [Mycena olivaceomarginata]